MPSAKQIAANRANSQKSTGPRTEAGRSRASLNALKHGCTAQTIILPGEDGSHFHAFHQSFIADFKPKGALESALVQELAHAQWAINRIRAHEANLFAIGHEQNAGQFETGGDQAIQAAFAAATTSKTEATTLSHFGLYLQRNSRMFLNTLKTLREIQATRIASEQAALQDAAQTAVLHEKLKMPFDPAAFGFVCSLSEIAPLIRRERFHQATAPHFQVNNAA